MKDIVFPSEIYGRGDSLAYMYPNIWKDIIFIGTEYERAKAALRSPYTSKKMKKRIIAEMKMIHDHPDRIASHESLHQTLHNIEEGTASHKLDKLFPYKFPSRTGLPARLKK